MAGNELVESFNSRTPGGVRPIELTAQIFVEEVSIHAPREGCDVAQGAMGLFGAEFQFTHPGRGATIK